MSTVEEIERAIGALTPDEWEELRAWLEQYIRPDSFDARIHADLLAGGLDKAIAQALDDEEHGRVRPL
jgi:hypothetical protein